MKGAFIFFGMSRMLSFIGALLLVPLAVSVYSGDGTASAFWPSLITTAAGAALFQVGGRTRKRQMPLTEGTALLFFAWFVLALVGAMPFVCAGILVPADAFTEGMAAFTTNGTFMSIEQVPATFRIWHILMEWAGALIFISFFVTVVPQVSNVFSFGLTGNNPFVFTTGLTRMFSFVKAVSIIYVFLTVLSCIAYTAAGLSFDTAVLQAMTTVSTGGTSLVPLVSPGLVAAAMIGMFLSSCNFLLLYRILRERSIRAFRFNTEIRVFAVLVIGATFLVAMNIRDGGLYPWSDSLRTALFHVLSFVSTTGFTGPEAVTFPEFDRLLLFLLVFVGGCVGSVTGGMRVLRFLILLKMTGRELLRTLHPQMVVNVKANNMSVPLPVISRVLNVFFLFTVMFFFSALVLSLAGLTPLQALGLAGAGLTGTSAAASLFETAELTALPVWAKLYYSFTMALGRMEIVAFFIVLQTGTHFLRHRW